MSGIAFSLNVVGTLEFLPKTTFKGLNIDKLFKDTHPPFFSWYDTYFVKSTFEQLSKLTDTFSVVENFDDSGI